MANFLSLPVELRNIIYELLLVFQETLTCPGKQSQKQCQPGALTLGLLRANKQVHDETSAIFYAQNRIDFTKCTSKHVISFLTQVGPKNTSYIQHIRIDFDFSQEFLYDITFEDSVLAEIKRRGGTKLCTLTTSLHSTQAMILEANGIDYNTVVDQLPLVDSRFKALSLVIIVEMYKKDGRGNNNMQKDMECRGWKIKELDCKS